MKEFDDVQCPACLGLSGAAAWACDAIESNCKCPLCGAVSETVNVFGYWDTRPGIESPVMPSSALNEW